MKDVDVGWGRSFFDIINNKEVLKVASSTGIEGYRVPAQHQYKLNTNHNQLNHKHLSLLPSNATDDWWARQKWLCPELVRIS